MTSLDLDRVISLAQQISQECEADARGIDRTPFTPVGIGGTFGTVLANQMALAKALESLALHVKGGAA